MVLHRYSYRHVSLMVVYFVSLQPNYNFGRRRKKKKKEVTTT